MIRPWVPQPVPEPNPIEVLIQQHNCCANRSPSFFEGNGLAMLAVAYLLGRNCAPRQVPQVWIVDGTLRK
jgi:hypothetical protein